MASTGSRPVSRTEDEPCAAAFFTYKHFKNKAVSTVVKAVAVEEVGKTSAAAGGDVEMKDSKV